MDVPGLLRGCLSPKTGDSTTTPADGPARAASRHLQRAACRRTGDLDGRLHPAPYPPAGPRTPHPTPHTPLQAVSEFFTLDTMEKVLNCVPLGVDPRSPRSRGAGTGPADGVARLFCGDGPTPAVFFGDGPRQEEPESRQDDGPRPEGPRFTPREHAALEREAARHEDIKGGDRPGSLLQKVQATAWQLQNHLSPRNCGGGAGIGGLGFALRPHPAAGGEEEGAEAGGTPRAANRTPRGSAGPSAVLFGGANDDSGTPTGAAAQFSEAASPAVRIPGGLWHLHSRSSGDENEKKQAAEEGEDEVMRMRSPAGADKGADWDGAPSPSSSGGPLDVRPGRAPPPSPTPAQPNAPAIPPVAAGLLPAAQRAILAAQRAVSHATFMHSPPTSPNGQAYDDKYWMEDEVREGLAGMMQGFDAPHEAVEREGLEGHEEENGGRGKGRDAYDGARNMLEDARAMLDDEPCNAPQAIPEEATPQDGADARLAHLLAELPAAPPEAVGAAGDDEPYTPGYHPYATDDEANAHFDAIMARFELRLPDRGGGEDRSKEEHAKGTRPSKKQPRDGRRARAQPPVSPLMAKVAARRKRHSDEADEASSKASGSSFLAGTVGRKLNRRPSATSVDESTETVEAEDEASSTISSAVQEDGEAVVDDGTETVDTLEDKKESTDATPPRPRLGASRRNKRGSRRTARHRPAEAEPQEANEDCPDDEKVEAEEEGPDDDVASREAPSAGASEEIDEGEEEAASAKGDRGLDGILGSINGSSFDSSVNWDALAYSVSMSDNGSANGTPEAGLVTSEGPEPGSDVTGSVGVDAVPVPVTQTSSARPPRQAKPQAMADAPLDVPAAIAEGVKAMHAPPGTQNEVPPSPEQRVAIQARDEAKDANALVDESLTPRAWERIERIKKQHDDDIGKIRSMVIGPDSVEEVALSSVPQPAPLTRHASMQNDLTVETYSDEENVPLSPNAMSPIAATGQVKHRIESMKRQHEREREQVRGEMAPAYGEMTPRTHVRVEREVQSRIDAMREQHKANMERMRHALEEAQDGGASERPDAAVSASPRAKDERHIAESVRAFKTNAARFEKARARFASHRATYSPSPRRQPAGHFSFDTSPEVASLGTPATPGPNFDGASPRMASPRMAPPHVSSPRETSAKMKELMSKNEELEEEMRQIRLMSPKKSPAEETWKPLSPVRGLGASPHTRLPDAYTPSSARYNSPSHYGVSPSSLLPDSPAQRQNLQEDIAQEAQMNTRITGLIADVQSFLEENDRAQERLMADLF